MESAVDHLLLLASRTTTVVESGLTIWMEQSPPNNNVIIEQACVNNTRHKHANGNHHDLSLEDLTKNFFSRTTADDDGNQFARTLHRGVGKLLSPSLPLCKRGHYWLPSVAKELSPFFKYCGTDTHTAMKVFGGTVSVSRRKRHIYIYVCT